MCWIMMCLTLRWAGTRAVPPFSCKAPRCLWFQAQMVCWRTQGAKRRAVKRLVRSGFFTVTGGGKRAAPCTQPHTTSVAWQTTVAASHNCNLPTTKLL